MSNRFARRIRDGSIADPGQLKSEFKGLAKACHPDLAGPGAAEDFLALREEYEAALRDFERHRFGFRARAAGEAAAPGGSVASLFAALALFRKRGFPRRPRHYRQTLRYDYARFQLLRALGALCPEAAAAFAPFEEAAWEAAGGGGASERRIGHILDALADYALSGLPELRVPLVLELADFEGDASLDRRLGAFVRSLAALLSLGPSFGSGGEGSGHSAVVPRGGT